MTNDELLKQVKERANKWLEGNYDEDTKTRIREMMEHDETELVESFYRDLEFGTGGLRGIMGAGTNRMNIYTVGMSTQGLANYLKKQFSNLDEIRVAIAHDSRNNSRLFAKTAARILTGNGFRVYLFDGLRPTPELSFAIRHFSCQSGIVITASHNPKEYNGYKVYWEDGGQIVAPHDKSIIEEVKSIREIDEVKFGGPENLIENIGEEVDEIYIKTLTSLSLDPKAIRKYHDLKIVYTPIHGTGVTMVPRALRAFGFTEIYNVPEQDIPDGNFPTVISPNPEETAALKMAIDKAREVGADLVMGTDPDADRVGIVVKDQRGEFIILNGNQTATLLVYYMLLKWTKNRKLTGKEFIAKTIVTSDILDEIADHFKVKHFDTLTGFKWIAALIREHEGKLVYIGGGEESYGFMPGNFVRDKDAVSTCALIAEIAAWSKGQGKTLHDLLIEIYTQFSFYMESLISIVRKGKSGAEEIQEMMDKFRSSPPDSINGSDVMLIHDYLKQVTYDQMSHLRHDIDLPKSNVLQFVTMDGSKISMRPSGTEPKIKFYFSVSGKLEKKEDFEPVEKELLERIENIKKDLKLI